MGLARPAHLHPKGRGRSRAVPSVTRVTPRPARLGLALVLPALVLSTGAVVTGPAPEAAGGPAAASPARSAAAAPGGATDPRGAAGARGVADNPLAGHTWGVYKGFAEMAWEPYTKASGWQRTMLARIALRPKAKWFGRWLSHRDIGRKVREYVANATGGDDDVLVQLTTFRVDPWEGDACRRLPTKEQKRTYRLWVDNFAAALGNTRAQVIVQADGPFQLCAPRGSKVYKNLVRYQTRKLAALPRTAVYIEAGSAGWNHLKPARALKLLHGSGIGVARGFHLNTTHYEGTARQVRFGTRVVKALDRAGYPGKHFTVDTGQNGRGFTWKYNKRHHPGPFDHAPTCRRKKQHRCVTLGIPPTADVANAAWNLPDDVRAQALEHVDGYVWGARPWLYKQTKPFLKDRALRIARTTPFPRYPG